MRTSFKPAKRGDFAAIESMHRYTNSDGSMRNFYRYRLARVQSITRDGRVKRVLLPDGQELRNGDWDRTFILSRATVRDSELWEALTKRKKTFANLDEVCEFCIRFMSE